MSKAAFAAKPPSPFGQAFHSAPSGLARVAAGYVDEVIVTLRKMAAAGATAEEIGEVLGWKPERVAARIRRERLVWNKRGLDRHVTRSAAAIGYHQRSGRGWWHAAAKEMRAAGVKHQEIADRLGVSSSAVSSLFNAERNRPFVRLG